MIIIEKKESPIEIEKKEIIIEMSQRGPSGPRGLKGDTGEQGPKGEKGDTGDPGPTTWDGITDKPDFGALSLKDKADYLTDIINAPALGALSDHDTVDYETEVTNKPELGTMSAEDDAPADSEEYVRKNRSWSKLVRNQTQWGGISGSLQNQSDLRIALSGKAAVEHTHGNVGSSGKVGGGSYVITNGDRMLISDASNDNTLVMSSVIFDGTSTDKALTKKGSFESFAAPSMLCGTEESMAATRNYTSGSLIIVGKRLYSAMANITSGSALTIGGNVVETTLEQQIAIKNDAPSNDKTYGRKNGDWVEVTDELTDSGWKSLTNSSKFSGTIYYRKIGNIANVIFEVSSLVSARDSNGWTTLTTIPSGYRPTKDYHGCFFSQTSDQHCMLKVGVDGGVSITAMSGDTLPTTYAIYYSISYFI